MCHSGRLCGFQFPACSGPGGYLGCPAPSHPDVAPLFCSLSKGQRLTQDSVGCHCGEICDMEFWLLWGYLPQGFSSARSLVPSGAVQSLCTNEFLLLTSTMVSHVQAYLHFKQSSPQARRWGFTMQKKPN